MLEGLYHYNIRSDTKTMYKLKDFYKNVTKILALQWCGMK